MASHTIQLHRVLRAFIVPFSTSVLGSLLVSHDFCVPRRCSREPTRKQNAGATQASLAVASANHEVTQQPLLADPLTETGEDH